MTDMEIQRDDLINPPNARAQRAADQHILAECKKIRASAIALSRKHDFGRRPSALREYAHKGGVGIRSRFHQIG